MEIAITQPTTGSKKVPVRSVIKLGGRLIEPVAEHEQLYSLPAKQAGKRDHERRDPEDGDEEPVEEADHGPRRGRRRSRRRSRPSLTASTAITEAARPLTAPTGEVDLAQQQHQHDPDRDRRHRGDLPQVGEVDGAQEAVVGELEDRPDDRDRDQHANRAEISKSRRSARPSESPPARARQRW